MDTKKSQKILPWTKKDVAFTLTVYFLNALLLVLIFLSSLALSNVSIKDYLSDAAKFISFCVLLTLLISVIAVYFIFEDKDFLHNAINSEMIFLVLEIALVVCLVLGKYVSLFIRPFAIVALLILFLTDTRTSIFINMVFCIMLFLFDAFLGVGESFSIGIDQLVLFLIINIASGVLAVCCMNNVYSRLKLILFSFIISIPGVVCNLVEVIRSGGSDAQWTSLVASIFAGPVSVAVLLILLPVFEALFKKVSCFKFAELTDHKSKFIKKMIRQAPGTFNHSIIVSNIAEACATAIGEDALLARTCAYYHDIGKLRRPEFFKENQTKDANLHDDLTPELSASIIKAHTIDGYKLLKKNRISEQIADVCLQHHGTMPILFFYDKARKFTDGEVDIAQFCYPGPKPRTKIAAILMIADSAEAATRTLRDRSTEKVTDVVRKLVSERMKLGQFEECEITLKELNIIINTVINSLTGVYHRRIKYPKVSLDGLEGEKD